MLNETRRPIYGPRMKVIVTQSPPEVRKVSVSVCILDVVQDIMLYDETNDFGWLRHFRADIHELKKVDVMVI